MARDNRVGVVIVLVVLSVAGCEPGGPADAQPAATQPRKTIGKTTQNVLELSEALKQGAVLAEMSIQSSGLEIASEAYRTQVGKAGSLAVEQRMQFYRAEHGELPKTYEQFMKEIIGTGRPDGIALPMLPYYQEWAYDVENRTLVVVEFPARKQQRQQEAAGAAASVPP